MPNPCQLASLLIVLADPRRRPVSLPVTVLLSAVQPDTLLAGHRGLLDFGHITSRTEVHIQF